MGVKTEGVRSVVDSIKGSTSLEDFLTRKKGSGRKAWAKTEENREKVKEKVGEKRKTSMGELAKETGISRSTVRRICTGPLELKSVTQIKAQRVSATNVARRLERCAEWVGMMEDDWKFDPMKAYRGDEKIFRIGEVSGGNQNYMALISNKVKKYECKAEDLLREGGAFQGGKRVMVCLGASYFGGVGRPYFVPKGQFIDQTFYLTVLNSHYVVEATRMFRKSEISDYCFQQDGASAHTANSVQAACAELFPSFIAKKGWPSTSPDLTVLDYFIWGSLQNKVNEMRPQTLLDLQLAIEQCAESVPLELAQRAIDGFYDRRKLCVDQGGRTFKHVLKSKLNCPCPPRNGNAHAERPGEILDVPINDFEGVAEDADCSD